MSNYAVYSSVTMIALITLFLFALHRILAMHRIMDTKLFYILNDTGALKMKLKTIVDGISERTVIRPLPYYLAFREHESF